MPSDRSSARSRDGLYDTALAESEREAVAELLGYLENVCLTDRLKDVCLLTTLVRREPKSTSSQASRYEP